MSERRFQRAPGVVARMVGGELVLMPISQEIRVDSGSFPNIYVLNETGAAIWEALSRPSSRDDLARCLTESYEVLPERARADVDHLLGELSEYGVIVTHGES